MKMNNQPLFFFYTHSNDIFHAKQKSCILSCFYHCGVYIHKEPKENLRRSISLFSTKSLLISNWINSNDVFIGREDKENE